MNKEIHKEHDIDCSFKDFPHSNEWCNEKGQASILIKLEDGNITVEHGTEHDGTPLLFIPNAKMGSWDKIWETLKALQSN